MSLIQLVDPAIKYSGFDPKYTRRTLLSKYTEDNVAARNLILIFFAYSHIGNNISKLSEKRVNLVISGKVMKIVNDMDVKKVERKKEALTLPRVAIAFLPEYLYFRKYLTEELQDQTESSLNVHYKDVSFDGCPRINSMNGYSEFHKQMSNFIYKGKTEVAFDDKEFVQDYKRYQKIIRAGYAKDTEIHPKMNDAIDSAGINRRDAFDRIVLNIVDYRATISAAPGP
jgi:hypothetical protein